MYKVQSGSRFHFNKGHMGSLVSFFPKSNVEMTHLNTIKYAKQMQQRVHLKPLDYSNSVTIHASVTFSDLFLLTILPRLHMLTPLLHQVISQINYEDIQHSKMYWL